MSKVCCVCGREFEPKRKDQVTCADEDCRKAHYREVEMRWKKNHYDKVLEQNRNWMKKQRARKKAEKEARLARQNFVADGYAERQMAKTLAMVGKVRTEL